MNTIRVIPVVAGLAAALAFTGVEAKTCKPDVTWQHEHVKDKSQRRTTDVKGTRATILEICFTDDSAGKDLKVEVLFEGQHEGRPITAGECFEQYSKWAVIRSHGTKNADGPAAVSGLYRICKE